MKIVRCTLCVFWGSLLHNLTTVYYGSLVKGIARNGWIVDEFSKTKSGVVGFMKTILLEGDVGGLCFRKVHRFRNQVSS